MAKALNRYGSLIENIFFDRYSTGAKSLDFTREDIETAASTLSIKLPKNLGDVLYSFRFRNALPDRIVATQPEGMEWVIELAGRALYKFSLRWRRRKSRLRCCIVFRIHPGGVRFFHSKWLRSVPRWRRLCSQEFL